MITPELRRQLVLANMLELQKRVLTNLVGNELSTTVDGESVQENAEILISGKLRERLSIKGA